MLKHKLKCNFCKKDFRSNREVAKFCSLHCSNKFNKGTKETAQPKMARVSRKDWQYYWKLYHKGQVPLQPLLNLMTDHLVNNKRK